MKFSSLWIILFFSLCVGRVLFVDIGGLLVGLVIGELVGGGLVGGDLVGFVLIKNVYVIIFLFFGGVKRFNRVNKIFLY